MRAIDTLEAIPAGSTTQWTRIRGTDASNPAPFASASASILARLRVIYVPICDDQGRRFRRVVTRGGGDVEPGRSDDDVAVNGDASYRFGQT